ncbi:MAG TPA: DUF4080 domain-containing protein [Clostridiales bacterium]|nr:DUF4080 domain-containing protein [Clostridiales bacterium]
MDKTFNVIICALNSKYIHSSLAPWYLLAGIKQWCGEGINASVLEGTIKDDTGKIFAKIADKKPNVLGFCCYIWNITAVLKLSKLVKENSPDTILVLGGPEVSYNAGRLLEEHPFIDCIISGEGEKPFARLLNSLYREEPLSGIPGLNFRSGGEIVESSPFVDNQQPPSPYCREYFETLDNRLAYLETSRGCPYSCAFCLSGRAGSVRYFDIERAKKELVLLSKSGARTVKLVDRTFNANKKRAAELIEFIITNRGTQIPEGVCFHFEIAGDILDESLLSLFNSAPKGLFQLEIGLQSFNPKTLKAINRQTDTDRLKENIRRLLKPQNIHIHIDLIAGLPFEGLDSFAESFNTAYSLKPHMLQLGFLKLLHGSPMRQNREKYPCRFSERPPYEVVETPWISRDELQLLRYAEDALNRLYNSGRFPRTLEYILSQAETTPFKLFCEFGKYCGEKDISGISLDGYTALVFDYFSRWENIDKSVLRDKLACDRIATNPAGYLPPALTSEDEVIRLKQILKQLNLNRETAQIKGIKRGAAILHSENCIVYADYTGKDPVTGEYELKKIKLE